MTSVRNRRKQKSSLPRQTRRLNDKRKKVRILSNAIIAAQWDEKLTLSQNYKNLGLTARLSRPSGGTQKELGKVTQSSAQQQQQQQLQSSAVKEAKIVRNPQTGEFERLEYVSTESVLDAPVTPSVTAATDVVKQLEQYAARGERTRERSQSEREQYWIEELIEVYGDDYERMARDRKRNIWQQSAGDIRRRVLKWKKQNK
ncbi:ribosome biogenesis protein Nop16 [Myxozyma melibiosi]|uniref:Nucleolar protein 16 n=1 Tax=Myxozyma melibiosi TaxID=54550 RepID=A0ABR1F8L2_9ASCO